MHAIAPMRLSSFLAFLLASSSALSQSAPPDNLASDRVGSIAAEFNVDEAGAASYRVPIFVVPGRAGVQPELALRYRSNAGFGPLGVGWGIEGLSSVTRCRATREAGDFRDGAGSPIDGVPAGITLTNSDRFCLDGQRLVSWTGTYGADGSTYRLELDPYTKITLIDADSENGPDSFTVQRRDGSTSFYGTTADSYVNANNGGTVVSSVAASWAIAKVRDSAGNYLSYEYVEDAPNANYGSDHRIAVIRYTGKDNMPGQSGPTLAPFASVTFQYEDIASPRSGYFGGSRASLRKRLISINSNGVRYYRLAYLQANASEAAGSKQDIVREVRECWANNDTDCYPPTRFDWSETTVSFDGGRFETRLAFQDLEHARFGDVDGDGRLDMVWIENTNTSSCPTNRVRVAYFFRTEGKALDIDNRPSQLEVCTQHSSPTVDEYWGLIDYDGDGRDDLLLADRSTISPVPGGGMPRWRVHPSVGRDGFDVEQDLLAPAAGQGTTVTIPVVNEETNTGALAQLSDFNGDGLLDIIYRASDTRTEVRLLEREPGQSRFRFSAPFEVEILVPEIGCVTCNVAGVQLANQYRPQDFTSDGGVELNVLMCEEPPNVLPRGSAVPQMTPAQIALLPHCAATWYRRPHVFRQVARQDSPTRKIQFGAYAEVPDGFMGAETLAGDFNGDGNPDALAKITRYLPNPNGPSPPFVPSVTWDLCINNVDSPLDTARIGCGPVAGGTEWRSVNVVDINGDGRSDVLYSRESVSAFRVRYANQDGSLGAEQTNPGGGALALFNEEHPWRHWFQDFDSDGLIDFMAMQIGSNNNVYLSSVSTVDLVRPRDVITKITNGYGASTDIDYLPLNNRDVHVPDQGSRKDNDADAPGVTQWGRQSPVIDLNASMFVVSSVQSDAPKEGAPSARSATHYRYAGAKMQAGGRGFLGFREVWSIDGNYPGQHILTRTEYRQDFPFTGRPLASSKYVAQGDYTPDDCRGTGRWRTTCAFEYVAASGNPPRKNTFAVPTSVRVKQGINEYLSTPAFSASSANQSWFTSLLIAQDRSYDLETGTLLSLVKSAFIHDANGNVELTGIETCADLDCAEKVSHQITVNTYADDPSRWWLGRMTSSTVRYCDPTPVGTLCADVGDLVRTTRFAYEMGTDPNEVARSGQLKKEESQGCAQSPCAQNDPNRTLSIRTLYDYNVYGDKVRSYTCSGDLTDTQCRDLNAIKFQPDAVGSPPTNKVHRTTRYEYDANGRFLIAEWQPFFDPTVPVRLWAERRTMEVVSRDAFGEVQQARDAFGVDAWTWRGKLGRTYVVQTETGGTATTTYRWCSDYNPQTEAPICPSRSDLRFREQIVTSGEPTIWVYRDLLGREVMRAVASFNAGIANKDATATCTEYDAYSRPVRVSIPAFLTGTINATNGPTFAGVTAPCAGISLHSRETFDVLGRTKTRVAPDGSATELTYAGYNVLRKEPDNNAAGVLNTNRTWTETKNAAGETESITDPNGFTVSYVRDVARNVTMVQRDAGRGVISNIVQFDLLGRKAVVQDPDAGTTTFEYNAAGEMIRSQDGRGLVVEQFYDARGRVWYRKTGATPNTGELVFRNGFESGETGSDLVDRYAFDYDSALATSLPGKLVEERREVAGQQTFKRRMAYDTFGRESSRTSTIDGTDYVESTQYDALGRPFKQSLGFSFTVNGQARSYLQREELHYGPRGHLTSICQAPDASSTPSSCNLSQVYWRLYEQDARGNNIRERKHDSAALETRRSYEIATGRIDTLQSGSSNPAASLQSWNLDFDAAGNLTQRLDQRSGFKEVAYYDRLDRLSRINLQGPGLPGAGIDTMLLAYDKIGNVCQKTVAGTSQAYTYAGMAGCGIAGLPGSANGISTASPHAVVTAYGKTYFYDTSGNQLLVRQGASDVRAVDYDAYNRPTSLIEGSYLNPASQTDFQYDGGGTRIKRVDTQSGQATTTYYIGATERIQGAQAGCTQSGCVRVRRSIGGSLILVSTYNGTVGDPLIEYRYVFTDHLGSVEIITDQTGATTGSAIERTSFDGHGRRRDPLNPLNPVLGPIGNSTKRGFTNHEHVDRLGIVHFGGRLYDPELGRFIQADPLVEPDATQGLNRYSYVLNNPLTLTDPSGYLSSRWQGVRLIATIAINIYMGGVFNGMLGLEKSAMLGHMMAGATSGAINGGTEGAAWGAFSAALFHNIGTGFDKGNLAGYMKSGRELNVFGRVAKAVTHGYVGGMLHLLQGGKFGHGFASAGMTELTSPLIGKIQNSFAQTTAAALVGGSISAVSGGKFANGAVTAAFSYSFNSALHDESWDDLMPRALEYAQGFMGPPSPTDDLAVSSANIALQEVAVAINAARDREAANIYRLAELTYNPSDQHFFDAAQQGKSVAAYAAGKYSGNQLVSGTRIVFGSAFALFSHPRLNSYYHGANFVRGGLGASFWAVAHEMGHLTQAGRSGSNQPIREFNANKFAYQIRSYSSANIDREAVLCRDCGVR